jgi:hypothetical protein
MIKPNQIPDEVAAAVMHCFHTRNAAKAAVASAINAWPGMVEKQANENLLLANLNPAIILPITEPSDDK